MSLTTLIIVEIKLPCNLLAEPLHPKDGTERTDPIPDAIDDLECLRIDPRIVKGLI